MKSIPSPTQHPIVLFDGVCNLCESSVQFILRRDGSARFRFCALQSDIGHDILQQHGLPAGSLESLVLIDDAGAWQRSDAALRIAGQLDGPWRMAKVLFVIPRPLRDAVYNFIARHRYRWFGRKAECLLPDAELVSRFLDAASTTEE